MRRAISLAFAGTVSATSPVSQVVSLLKNMQTDLATEEADDKTAQTKMECWCKDTKKSSKAEIDQSTATIEAKSAEAAAETGKAAEAATKAANAEKTLEATRKQLDQMTATRAQEQATFQETEKELIQSISALESAVTVLSKHNSFLQTGKGIKEVADTLEATLPKYNSRHLGEITPSQNKVLMSFVSQPSFGAYQSQSGEIFGILGAMKDDFTNDLADQRSQEKSAIETYTKGKQLSLQTIAAQEKQYANQSSKSGNAKAKAAAAEASQANAEDTLAASNTLLDETTATCNTADADYAARVKARGEEVEAVAQALAFLNSDEAHKLFHSTFSSFLQVKNQKVHKVAHKLSVAGFNFRNKEMFSLAQAIRAGAFDKVINAIDKLVKELDETIKKDASDKDSCTNELNEKTATLAELNNEIEKNDAKLTQLGARKKDIEADIAQANEKIATTQTEQKELSQQREIANKDFQNTVKDQNSSIQVLNQALTVLKEVYGTSLLQQPEQFQDAGRHSGGNSVLAMITSIISDCQKSKELAVQSENSEQKAYEQAMMGMNDLVSKVTDTRDQLTGELGDVNSEMADKESTLTTQNNKKKSQETGLAAKQDSCKFLFDNFEVRLQHMNDEREALGEAKAFLNGMTDAS